MSNPETIFTPGTLPDLIRQSFFLADSCIITPAITEAFIAGIARQDFSILANLLRDERTDRFNIFLTHDIDWLNPAHPYSVLKYAYTLINPSYRWLSFRTITQKDALLRNIERLIELEHQLDVSSLFFTGASAKPASLGRYDIRYSTQSSLFKELIELLETNSHSIGLHSSYQACEDQLIGTEKKELETYIATNVTTHRSHFLHYDPDKLYAQLGQCGIEYDFGLGKARSVGFVNHFPGKFRPVNTRAQQTYPVTCIPLLLMDNVFFFQPRKDVMEQFREALSLLKRSNGSACILFHPENMLLMPELWSYYEEILDICLQEGANMNPQLH